MRKNGVTILVLLLLPLAGACPALAQAESGTEKNALADSPAYWSVDAIIDVYAKGVGRQYNLTEAQSEYTHKLLTQRVKQFLKDYEKDVRSLFAEYYDYQIKREVPPPEIVKEWAQRGTPLIAAMKKEIWEGNMEWRKILDDNQKLKHDRDLEVMRSQFDQLEDRLRRWNEGQVQEGDFGRTRTDTGPVGTRDPENAWEFYVRHFIRSYSLDAGQQETAYSVLRELREEAARYRDKHKDELAELETAAEKKRAEAEAIIKKRSPSDPKAGGEEAKKIFEQRQELLQRRAELLQPISAGLFNQLKARLENIPTAGQRQARESHLAALGARGDRGRFGSPATRPASRIEPVPATQPADSPTSQPSVAVTGP